MANAAWFDGLPEDLQQLLLDVGAEIGEKSTATIMQVGEDTLAELQECGGVVTMLEGEAKAGFSKVMTEQVMPAMANLVDAEALDAAAAFTSE